MSPEGLIAAAVGATVSVFLVGLYLGYRLLRDQLEQLRRERLALLGELRSALDDQVTGREAARSMVEVAWKVASARGVGGSAGDVASRHRLLLDDAPARDLAASPSGETGESRGVAS